MVKNERTVPWQDYAIVGVYGIFPYAHERMMGQRAAFNCNIDTWILLPILRSISNLR